MHEVLKSHILHLLQKDPVPRKLVHLERELGISAELKGAFAEALEALCAEGSVIVGPRDIVKLPALSDEVTGIFRATARGHGFVTPQQSHAEGDVFISAKATGSAMTGDRVVAKLIRKKTRQGPDRLTGKIVKVLERAHVMVVGTLRQEQDRWLVQPDGGDFSHPIDIEAADPRRLRSGDKVAVRIRSYPSGSQRACGTVTDVLGRTGRHDAEIASVIQRYALPDAFDSGSLVEACNARAAFDPRDTHGREDVTDELIVTIDPPDAQDFDDAISLTHKEDGSRVLGVHIADVSHFVPAGSALDRAARLRGNSVYLPGRTLPMLPEMLSNGVCSLQPDQRRYARSVYLAYSKDGAVRSTRFANTLIKSRARLTYQQADATLKGKTGDLPADVVTLLRDMEALARCIERRRRQAGMIQLKMPACEVLLDDSGRVTGVAPEDTSYPHTIIEMFMVEANVAVATLLDRLCIPFMRRIHPEPDAKVLQRLSQTLRLLGVTLSRRPQRADFQALLERVGGSRIALPVNLLVLRSLQRAEYAPVSVGHYALAASKYCHFTSPIRRYADLMVHRALQAYLTGQVERARRQHAFDELVDIGRHLSETEETADDATQEARTILVLHLLRQRVGDELNGMVVSLTQFGASVHLPEYGVEGLVPREALGPDRWQFDEQNQCLIGRHTGALLRLAQPLRVRIVAVQAAAGQLDLAPARSLIPKMPRPTQKQKPQRKRRRTRKKR